MLAEAIQTITIPEALYQLSGQVRQLSLLVQIMTGIVAVAALGIVLTLWGGKKNAKRA